MAEALRRNALGASRSRQHRDAIAGDVNVGLHRAPAYARLFHQKHHEPNPLLRLRGRSGRAGRPAQFSPRLSCLRVAPDPARIGRTAERNRVITETFTAAELHGCPDATFETVERGDIALIRRGGRLYRLARHRPLVAVTPRPNLAPSARYSPVAWSWRVDSNGALRLVRPSSDDRHGSAN